ncbi:MAG: glutamine amidotransferase, partial [Alphaproteobacteria bacterium]
MAQIKVLLAGESWVTSALHVKGVNLFTASEFQIGIGSLTAALAGSEIELTHLPGHQVPAEFPGSKEEIAAYDVVVLSDIGSDSLLLHPDTYVRSQRTTNRLKLLSQCVSAGTGFLMIGGYYSFQGINGAARYHRTPIEDLLPVSMLPHDDRVEVPEGFEPVVVAGTDHPVLQGLGGNWPYLLGFNEVRPKE